MCPHSSILLLIAFVFLLFTPADGQIVQDTGKQPGSILASDTPAKQVEHVSFHLANVAENIQEAPDFLRVPLATNSDDAQPGSQTPPSSPDSWPELRTHSLEALLAEEIGKIIQSFETVINGTVSLGMVFHDILESTSPDGVPSSNVPLSPVLKKLVQFIAIAHDDFRGRFPLPATAQGHAERVKTVSDALERLRQLVIRLARDNEIEQEVIERHLARAIPLLHHAGVLVGDVAELYPAVIEALVLNLSAVLLPEAVFLRSLVILYCLGPYVLGRDTIGGWLLKHASEAWRV